MKAALIVPSRQPCGIADYSYALRSRFKSELDIISTPFFRACGYDIMHVQFEATLFRKGRTTVFPRLMQANSDIIKVVTVHEVWENNPYISERPAGKGLIPFLKQLRYDFRHALESREERLARLRYLSEAIIVHTRFAKHVLTRKGCDPEIVHVLPMPVFDRRPDPRTLPGLVHSKDKLTALLFGFITPTVDYETVFRAISELRSIYTLVIAGGIRRTEDSGLNSHIEQLIDKYGIRDSVIRLGHVPDKDLDALFTSANVFIHAPKSKTASASLAHALGAGLPIIATNMHHIAEINAEHNCVRTFDEGDASELLRHLRELIDKDARVSAREKVRFYSEGHTLDKFAENHLSLYRRLLEHRN